MRATPLVDLYWKARGFTAPLFLIVSGWAVSVRIQRGRARGLDISRGRVRRVLLLLFIGYALRWPGWGVAQLAAGDQDVWAHLLSFDALHTIAIALLAASLVLALPWSRREQAWAFGALALLCVALGMPAPAPLVPHVAALPRSVPALALAQALGGSSPFPILPWAAYFFVGALVGLLAGAGGGRGAAAMALVGAVLVGATFGSGVGEMPMGHPLLFAFRCGVVLLVLAALSKVPAAAAARVAPIGRASLGVYAIHVPIVYGWSTYPPGSRSAWVRTSASGAGSSWRPRCSRRASRSRQRSSRCGAARPRARAGRRNGSPLTAGAPRSRAPASRASRGRPPRSGRSRARRGLREEGDRAPLGPKSGQIGQPATKATCPPAGVASSATRGFARASAMGSVSAGTIGSSIAAIARAAGGRRRGSGRTRSAPVVLRGREPVQRRRHRRVELGERARAAHARDVERGREAVGLRERLLPQPAKEALPVHSVPESGPVEGARRAEEVERDGDAQAARISGRASPRSPTYFTTTFPPSENPARTIGRPGRSAASRVTTSVEVAGVARVVEAGQPVRLARAPAEVERERVEAAGERDGDEAPDVRGARRALEAVTHHRHRSLGPGAVASGRGVAIDVDEVAVRQLQRSRRARGRGYTRARLAKIVIACAPRSQGAGE